MTTAHTAMPLVRGKPIMKGVQINDVTGKQFAIVYSTFSAADELIAAVNAHDDLVERLEAICKMIETVLDSGDVKGDNFDCLMAEFKQSRSALAKAGAA